MSYIISNALCYVHFVVEKSEAQKVGWLARTQSDEDDDQV